MVEIHPSAVVAEDVEIGDGTTIGPYAIIESGVRIGQDNRIMAHAFVGQRTKLGDANVIHPFASIGHEPQDKSVTAELVSYTEIGDGNVFREHSSVHRATKDGAATKVGSRGYFMIGSHIAHDCIVGDQVIMVNNSSLGGHAQLGDGAIVSAMSTVHQFCRVGRLVMFSALSACNKDLPPFLIFGGRPAVSQGLNRVGLKRNGVGPAARKEIAQAFRWLYREGLPIGDALARIEAELESPEIGELVAFIRSSKRGINLGFGDAELRASKRTGRERHGIDDDDLDGEDDGDEAL